MPWFPDFVSAVELVRLQRRRSGQAAPVGQYFEALHAGDARALEDVWPGEVVVDDPRTGEIRGHAQLRRFVSRNPSWLADNHLVRTEVVASTLVDGRAVVELLAHLERDGEDVAWPVAVVAESPDDRTVGVPHVLHAVAGRRAPPRAATDPRAGGPASGRRRGRYLAALAAGDTEAAVDAFSADGHVREFVGPGSVHRGRAQLRSYFDVCFGSGGGLDLQLCAVSDDGVRCAVEYNCGRWGSHDLPPQAGIGVYERGSEGLLVAARVYDDVESPVGRD